MRLAVFTGQYFWFDGKHYSTDEAFVKFVISFHPYFDKIILCDAVIREGKRQVYPIDSGEIAVCALPNFSVYSFWKNILCNFPIIYRVINQNIPQWDIVWLHAPHPVTLIFAHICRKASKPYFLFIRQNLKVYVGYRNQGVRRMIAVSAAAVLEYLCRRLAKSTVTFAVGKEILHLYRRRGARAYETAVSLVSDEHIPDHLQEKTSDDSGQVKLLSVGRLDPEKGTIFLIRAIAEMVSRGMRNVVLTLVGTGGEERELRREVHNRNLTPYVRFLGYLSHDAQLFSIYRGSDIFVQPSLTEGWPQTLFEAMACGLPVIATKVGGIPHLIQDGENGILVAPASPHEICRAVDRLLNDPELKGRIVKNGLSTAKAHTMEAERDRIMARLRQFLGVPIRNAGAASWPSSSRVSRIPMTHGS